MGQRIDGFAPLFGDPLIGEVPPDPEDPVHRGSDRGGGCAPPGGDGLGGRRHPDHRGLRDPEMHRTRKGNQWHFGMKAHIGVDSRSKMIHAVVATAANVAA